MSTTAATGPVLQLAAWTRSVARSPLQNALILSTRPGIVSFSLGLPSPELFPVERLSAACEAVVSGTRSALQYGPPSTELKCHIVQLMRRRGVECTERQVFLTSGAQQAVRLICSLLLDSGRQIIAEEMSYPGFLQIARLHDSEFLPVPTDLATGMDVDTVEHLLSHGARPAFIYAITDGHNPLGVSLSKEKRAGLVSLARRYGVPILEEDPYGLLSYSSGTLPPMRAVEEDWVFYIGSLSKVLAPSLRIGWIVAPERVMPKLAILKEAADIDMATFAQHVAARVLGTGFLSGHIDQLRREYGFRREAMLSALSSFFPATARWVVPQCGVFVWVELAGSLDTLALLPTAVEQYGVAYLPGRAFSISGDFGAGSLRLNFSHPRVADIENGLDRLGRMLRNVSRS